VCTTGNTAHIDTIFKFLPHTRQHVESRVATSIMPYGGGIETYFRKPLDSLDYLRGSESEFNVI
jgi:hypothetical protein